MRRRWLPAMIPEGRAAITWLVGRVLLALALLAIVSIARPAFANGTIDLLPHLCADSGSPSRSACKPTPSVGHDGWARVRLDTPARLAPLAGGWHLFLPHRQLDAVDVAITYRDGTRTRLARSGGRLLIDWAPRGHPAFASPRPGREVAALDIAYRTTATRPSLSYLQAVPAPVFTQRQINFFLVVGLYIGTVGSALIYNLVISAGQHPPFQRIYMAWAVFALVNGLLTSGLLAAAWPALGGPTGIAVNNLVVAGLFSTATLFLLALVEPGLLPRPMILLGRFSAIAVGLTGLLVVAELWWPIPPLRLVAFLTTALNLLVVAVAAATAAIRGSRAIWFYILGWGAIFAFALLMIVWEAVGAPRSQLQDLGGMLAIAFESVALSLAIADRFRQIRGERDALERAHDIAAADRKALQRIAETDQLTGLGNRRVFEATLSAAKRGDVERLTLILIDIDYFKSFNDRLGHQGGDMILIEFAQRLRACVDEGDIVARLGGDEFAVLMAGAGADRIDRIVQALMTPDDSMGDIAAQPTISIGIARLPEDDLDPAHLYKNADLALYEAKRLGRARIFHYAPSLRLREQKRARHHPRPAQMNLPAEQH